MVRAHEPKSCSFTKRKMLSITNLLILLLILTLVGNITILLQILNNLENKSSNSKTVVDNLLNAGATTTTAKYSHQKIIEQKRDDILLNLLELVVATTEEVSEHSKETESPRPTLSPTKHKERFAVSPKIKKTNHEKSIEYSPITTISTEVTNLPTALRKSIDIEVLSSRKEVHVMVDGKIVYERISKYRNFRGIHVVILNQVDGTVMSSRVFDVYSHTQDQALLDYLYIIKPHRIFVFTIMDEGSMNLGVKARAYLAAFGSKHVHYLRYRDSWAFISWKDTPIKEGHQNAISKPGEIWGEPARAKASVQLMVTDKDACRWRGNKVEDRKRKEFCSKFDGYAHVCDCKSPMNIKLSAPPLAGTGVGGNKGIASKLPISVVAGNRPFYLFRMLRGLLTTPGVNKQMVTVYIDGFYEEVGGVAELFGVKFVHHEPICSRNCRISQHYKRTLNETFKNNPSADYMIILEEDLDVSKDIMDYFSQLIPVLASDESVYCVSAWNDQGYTHSCNDSSMLYRVETMPGLGWVLKRSLFAELEPKWPGKDVYWDWDIWTRMDQNRKGRECIIPDVSRTFHFGAMGLNVDPNFQNAYFNSHKLNTDTGITFDTGKITKTGYEKEMAQIIRNATPLTFNKSRCTHDDQIIPLFSSGSTYVMYMKQTRDRDYDTWTNLARCFKLWDLDVRGFHKQTWRFWLHGNHIVVVGSNSPYFKYKPKDISAVYLPKAKTKS